MSRGASLALIVFCQIAAMALWFSVSADAEAAETQSTEPQSLETPGVGLPTGVCGGGVCGAAQRGIWMRFERGAGLAALPGMYAGICYVRDDRYDPDREHHVGFLIEEGDPGAGRDTRDESDTRNAGAGRLFLRFSFFTAANPFDRLDIEAARLRLGAAGSPVLPVALYDGHAYAGYADTGFFARYWFRRDPATGRVLLVSYFGHRTTIICDAAGVG